MPRLALLLVAPLVTFAIACGGSPASTAPAVDPDPSAASTDEKGEAPAAVEEQTAPVPVGKFVSTGEMADKRTDHTALRLPDGRILAVGGRGFGKSNWGPLRHSSAEIYDPADGSWTETGSMAKERQAHTADLLDDGRVFVTGGQDSFDFHKKTEIWDPANDIWTAGPKMATKRWFHPSTRLQDGRVMVVGGNDDIFALVGSAEIFDPAANEFIPAGDLAQSRAEHTATLLNDGRVLVTGGGKGGLGQDETTYDSAEIWDPDTNEWTSAGVMSTGRAQHTATLLGDGRVLLAGSRGKIETTEIYDPATGEWSTAGSMTEWRALHSAQVLADGRVLVAGGIGDLDSTDVFDPATVVWSAAIPMTISRYEHTATAMGDGRVLFVGGNTLGRDGAGTLTNSAEIYEP